MFGLVDCNNFFISCERVFRPDLNGIPVVALSNNDGCVIARSNEAKVLGIPMGVPVYQYKNLFKKHGVVACSTNFSLYGEMSARVMDILRSYPAELEIYSIDEAFLDFKNGDFNYYEEGVKIKNHIHKWTDIPVSVGFAGTKTLAKLANRIAKKFPEKTGGVYFIDDDEKRIKALKWLKIEDVWGIGRRNSVKLRSMNISNAYEFVMLDDEYVNNVFTVTGLRTKKELEGISCLSYDDITEKKSITVSRSFPSNVKSFDYLRERIAEFANTASARMRRQNSACRSIMVYISTNKHRNDLPQYRNSIIVTMDRFTNSTIAITNYAIRGLSGIFKKEYEYKKAGIVLLDVKFSKYYQGNIFDDKEIIHRPLMKAVDKINYNFGRNKIHLAVHDPDLHKINTDILYKSGDMEFITVSEIKEFI